MPNKISSKIFILIVLILIMGGIGFYIIFLEEEERPSPIEKKEVVNYENLVIEVLPETFD